VLRHYLSLAALCLALPVFGEWRTVFFHDEDRSSLAIHELRFANEKRGVALAALSEKGNRKPVAVITSDAGATWKLTPLKEDGLSLFFLDVAHGWMVTDEGVWFTGDGGASFQKLVKMKGVARVHFLDAKRGFAVGGPKKVWETGDGGRNWRDVPAAQLPEAEANRSMYNWIDFSTPANGAIVGFHETTRNPLRHPAWLDPERAQRLRQWPSLTLALSTNDGGATWQPASSSIFGRISRLRMAPSGAGYALVEFHYEFDYPSEIYEVQANSTQSKSIFKAKNRAVTDMLLQPDGKLILGAVEPATTVRQLPVPGRVHILQGREGDWQEMKVDYRAVARRVVLARAEGEVWAATDTGMILKWAGR